MCGREADLLSICRRFNGKSAAGESVKLKIRVLKAKEMQRQPVSRGTERRLQREGKNFLSLSSNFFDGAKARAVAVASSSAVASLHSLSLSHSLVRESHARTASWSRASCSSSVDSSSSSSSSSLITRI